MYKYDPATISPSELPIARRARRHYEQLWAFGSAKALCERLCYLPAVPDITPQEYESIAKVANGEPWPVPDHPYTNDDWHRDGDFSAAPGQEVTEEIYNYMFECMPPYRLPRCKRTEGITAGFLMGEPSSSDTRTGKQLYLAFGNNRRSYYFIGLLPIHPEE